MLKSTIPAALIIAACSLPAYAECDFFSLDSIMLASDSENNCLDFSTSIESFGQRMMEISGLSAEEAESTPDYWTDWVLQSKEALFITQSLESNYVGLGMWFPEDLEDEQYEMSTEEWLLNHGLQLSIGFGEKVQGQPRMRFDYRWHDSSDADLMMQVELPF
ncbi:hypothetical protein FCV44_12195 [Vibrio kanaloae]|uniref:hypothetical protein n=1 Tax=Vibrio kanaloae TaxID=170673 RepID=UPI0010BEDBBD|nr:hypothetical protein [Vibrio kanaloae]TKE96199.1 hypothetical protein FCV44_12195 [Vibrio kanaloae]TKF16623.1 hypothetical protein FCV47_10540 [Vibrio kanaloae]